MISTVNNSLPEEQAPAPAAHAESPAPAMEAAAEATTAPAEVPTEPPPAASDAVPADPTAAAPAPPDLSPAATGARLAELFPALFVGPDGKGTWRAIKLRIHADIQARAPGEFSKRTLGIFFSRYTTTTAYLKALAAPGAQRHDLDGQPAGEITDEHRTLAAEEVARRQALAAERRASFRKPLPRAVPAQAAAGAATVEGDAPAPIERARRDDRRPAAPPRDRPPRRDDARGEGAPRRPPLPGARPAPHRDAPPRRDPRPSAPLAEAAPAATALPADPAQRERAMLLRAFESSPLSKANFCALKRISEAELDAQLALAREERGGARRA
jgi:ProP effector